MLSEVQAGYLKPYKNTVSVVDTECKIANKISSETEASRYLLLQFDSHFPPVPTACSYVYTVTARDKISTNTALIIIQNHIPKTHQQQNEHNNILLFSKMKN